MTKLIYLDANATCPILPDVLQSIQHAYVDAWANPSSTHIAGLKAKAAMDMARAQVADFLGAADPNEIVFTSCGTESNHLLLFSVLENFNKCHPTDSGAGAVPHVIAFALEHMSILLPLHDLSRKKQIRLSILAPLPSGECNLAQLESLLDDDTVLLCLMAAHNETGVIQPVQDVLQMVHSVLKDRKSRNISVPLHVHSDASQGLGKIPLNAAELLVDSLTLAGHKFGGPRVGALYVRNLHIQPSLLGAVLKGGGQESGHRSGTPNTPLILGLAKACELVKASFTHDVSQMSYLRNLLEERLKEACTAINVQCIIHGESAPRTPSTSFISFIVDANKNINPHTTTTRPHFSNRSILASAQVICASVGAACHSDSSFGSPQSLLLMGVNPDVAQSAIRFSVGRSTTEAEIDMAVDTIASVLKESILSEQ